MSTIDRARDPAPDDFFAIHNGFGRYGCEHIFLQVFPRRAAGRRIEIYDHDQRIAFELSAEQAKALADLLCVSSVSPQSDGSAS